MRVAVDTNRDIDLCKGHASVYRQLRSQGTPIPTNHMWVAALVLQHDLVLHARGDHFDHLPQVLRV